MLLIINQNLEQKNKYIYIYYIMSLDITHPEYFMLRNSNVRVTIGSLKYVHQSSMGGGECHEYTNDIDKSKLDLVVLTSSLSITIGWLVINTTLTPAEFKSLKAYLDSKIAQAGGKKRVTRKTTKKVSKKKTSKK